MRAVAIVQARMGSTRLPGKVLMPILRRPVLWHVVRRLRWVPALSEVVVATSDRPGDEPIRRLCAEEGIAMFAGSEDDVLDRFYHAARFFHADPVVRVTADCPFVDPQVVSALLSLYSRGQHDHVGVATGAGAVFLEGGRFPDGLDAECFSFAILETAWRESALPSDREHVTPYIWRTPGRFRNGALKADQDYSRLRWTLDNPSDFELIRQVYEALYREDRPFLMSDILRHIEDHPALATVNRELIGKEGYAALWHGMAPGAERQGGDPK